MQRPGKNRLLLVFLTASLLLNFREAKAEWGIGVSGNLGSGLGYTREQQGDVTTWSFSRTDNYNLGLNGKIFDPRLATFNIAGGLSMSDFSSNQKTGAEDSRQLSFAGNLSLLPGKPYPLDLRLSQSHFTGSANTDVLSFGGSWRLIYGALPSTFLNFDRVNIQSTGETKTDTTFTTGTMRLAKRLFDSDMDAEFGLQHFANDLHGVSTLRQFGRFGSTTLWSPATSLRFNGDYSLQEESRNFGANFSLVNRPDPTLSRSLNLGIRNLTGKEQGETALDANGAISKAFKPYDTLSITPFTSAFLSRQFGSGESGDSISLNWAFGSSLVSSYFRSVLASADYGLGLSYANQEEGESNLGTTNQFHVGLQSVIFEPYRVRGDYTFTLERTLTDRNRHQASLRAEGPVMPTLFFRSYAEFFNEDATFSSQGTKLSAEQTSLTFGSGLTYTGIQQLYFDLGANASRSENQTTSSWITRLTANLNYRPRERLTLTLNGTRESDTLNTQTRYEMITRVLFRFGQSMVNLEYRFESHSILNQQGQGHSIHININRPFRFSF